METYTQMYYFDFMYILILFYKIIFLLIVCKNTYMFRYFMVCFIYLCTVEFWKELQDVTKYENLIFDKITNVRLLS